jgi:tRNA (guanine-N7-)-methyltransferase
MTSNNYRRRIRTKPPPAHIAEKYLRYWDMGDLYSHPERYPKITSNILFGNENQLQLEIGCGVGEHLVALAKENPKVNFVGVDTFGKALYQTVMRSNKAHLDNILLIRADIKLVYPLLFTKSLKKVYLHFPIPHHGRYRNRRIFTQQFLDVFYRALEPEGRISFISDDQRYFERILSVAKDDQRYEVEEIYDGSSDFDRLQMSHYQRLWRDHGRTIKGFILAKID